MMKFWHKTGQQVQGLDRYRYFLPVGIKALHEQYQQRGEERKGEQRQS